jgi:hypothetical protein
MRCHADHACRNATTQTAGNLRITTMDDLCGPWIARRFAQEATWSLSQDELAQLLEFLKAPKAGWSHTKEQLHQELTERLEDFYSTEVQVSGGSRDRLASPGGPEDADLGIILHLQSEEDAIGNFWDPRSATIRLLEEKGISDEFTLDMTGIGEQKKHSMAGPPALRSDGAEISGLSIVKCPLIFWKSYHCRSLSLDPAAPEKIFAETSAKQLNA